jgi:foldase protein PrsA
MLRNRWLKKWKLFGILALTAAVLAACGGGKGTLAVYKLTAGGEEQKLTQKQFDKFLNVNLFLNPNYALYAELPAFKQDLLKQYVSFQVLGSRLSGEEAKEAEKKAKEEVKTFKDNYGKEAEDALKEADLGYGDLEAYVALYTKAIKYLESQVTEEELRKAYEEPLADNPDAYTTATVSHILIGTVDPTTQEEKRTKEEALKLANEVRDKLLGGADFAEMAAEYSEDEGSKQTGGTYTNVNVNNWVENFKQAALTLPLNEISEPVETEYGYHIIKVSERKVPTYEEMKDAIRSQVTWDKFIEFMTTEVDALIIENNLPKEEEPADESADDEAGEDQTDEGQADESEADGAGAGSAEGEAAKYRPSAALACIVFSSEIQGANGAFRRDSNMDPRRGSMSIFRCGCLCIRHWEKKNTMASHTGNPKKHFRYSRHHRNASVQSIQIFEEREATKT